MGFGATGIMRRAATRPMAGAWRTPDLGTMLPTIRISTFGTLHVQRGDYTPTRYLMAWARRDILERYAGRA